MAGDPPLRVLQVLSACSADYREELVEGVVRVDGNLLVAKRLQRDLPSGDDVPEIYAQGWQFTGPIAIFATSASLARDCRLKKPNLTRRICPGLRRPRRTRPGASPSPPTSRRSSRGSRGLGGPCSARASSSSRLC